MNCPVCDEKLREVERHGVLVDICPGCKGMWLDRGELDKIIGMVSDSAADTPVEPQRLQTRPERAPEGYRDTQYDRPRDDQRRYDGDDRRYDDRKHHDQGYGHGKRKKREGLLGEIFEIFGD